MLNQVILVGRLVDDAVVNTLDDGRDTTEIQLAIQRNYKNPESGEYDADVVSITLWSGTAQSVSEYCKKGTTIGVKARISQQAGEPIAIIGEKVTFINTKKD